MEKYYAGLSTGMLIGFGLGLLMAGFLILMFAPI